jgi:hypothetical protein
MTQLAYLKELTDWDLVAEAAATTIHKNPKKVITGEWKDKMLYAEHSPIRCLLFSWKWTDLPYWVSVHFVRHHVGIEHFVRSQRTDHTGISRDELPQGAPVEHMCIANAQTIINTSRKRLCYKASPETMEAWNLIKDAMKPVDENLWHAMMPHCEYDRDRCREFNSCGRY